MDEITKVSEHGWYRRSFILALFGAAGALELGAAPDLATPTRMPAPGPLPTPDKWYQSYWYQFYAELRGPAPATQTLSIAKDFYLDAIGWNIETAALAELYQNETLLAKSYLDRSTVGALPLALPVFMPAGTSFVLKLKNPPDVYGPNHIALVLRGRQELTIEELNAVRLRMDAEFENEDED